MVEVIQPPPDSVVKEVVRPPLEELFAGWIEWMVTLRNFAPTTVKMYPRIVAEFCESYPDPLSDEVTEEAIEAWLLVRGGAPSTVSNRVSALCCFYRYAKKMKLRKDNPVSDVDRPKRTKNLPKPVEELDIWLDALDQVDIYSNERGTRGKRRVGETRDMAVFLCYTGLRMHEAVKCDWPVPCPPRMLVKGKGRKDARISVHQKAREAWARLGGKWPIAARGTQRRFEMALYFLPKSFTPHQCRHWLASTMIANGADVGDVKEQMRHESIQTTLGYAQWNIDRVEKAVALLP